MSAEEISNDQPVYLESYAIQVDTANDHWGISGRSGDYDILGATLQVGRDPME